MKRLVRARQPADDLAEDFWTAVRPCLDRLGRLVAAQAPPGSAEDVIQDTLLRAFRSWHRFEPGEAVLPWLCRIAERSCATAWRADVRWSRSRDNRPDIVSQGDSPGSDQHVASLHARAVVTAALTDLGARERVLLYRCDAEGVPRHLVAQSVALTPGAARVALHRARHRFRAWAKDRCDDLGVAAAFLVNGLRVRPRHGQTQAHLWATLPASVLLSVVAAVVVYPGANRDIASAAGGRQTGALSARAVPAPGDVGEGPPPPTELRRSTDHAVRSSSGAPPSQEQPTRSDGAAPPKYPPSSSPPLVPAARADVGAGGVNGGMRLDWTLPNDGHVEANPSVRCAHSTVTKTACTVTGAAPSVGPVEFYGSGDGDS